MSRFVWLGAGLFCASLSLSLVLADAPAQADAPVPTPPHHSPEVAEGGLVTRLADMMQKPPTAVLPGVARVWSLEPDTKANEVSTEIGEFVGTMPMHIHPDAEHRIVVMEGQVEFYIGNKKWLAKPGDFVLIPRGVQHKFALTKGEKRAIMITYDRPPVDRTKTIWLDPRPSSLQPATAPAPTGPKTSAK